MIAILIIIGVMFVLYRLLCSGRVQANKHSNYGPNRSEFKRINIR